MISSSRSKRTSDMGCGCHSLIIPPLRDMVHGAKEIIKTRIGVGVTTTEEENKRIEICRECEWVYS